jgi:hypothetical protein
MQLPVPKNRTIVHCLVLSALVVVPAFAASCAHSIANGTNGAGAGDGGGGGGLLPTTSGGSGSGSGIGAGIIMPTASQNCTKDRPCDDFVTIMDPNGPPAGDPKSAFGNPGAGTMQGGPCLAEPADGALYPKNWLRPRILWSGGGSSSFEIRIHSEVERNDLVVYTTKTYWLMDKDIWQKIAWTQPQGTAAARDGNLVGYPLTVTVRGIGSAGGSPTVSNTATITIAPALADGALVYWTTKSFDNNATNTTLQGFHVGDEGTTTALTATQVQQQVRAVPAGGGNLTGNFQTVFCIGCHTATPDGDYVSFTAQWPWPNALASIAAASPGTTPPWLSKGAIQNLSPDYRGNAYDSYYAPPAVNQVMLGIQTFSPAHYKTGDRRLISSIGSSWNTTGLFDTVGSATGVTSQLAWFDLEWDNATTLAGGLVDAGLPQAVPCNNPQGAMQACAPPQPSNGGWGILTRSGDNNSAGAPNWSHDVDGTDVVAYASTNVGTKDGRMDCSSTTSIATCTSDVFLVPYAGGAGGSAVGLPGASDPAYNEYYPAWSPDDQLIAFNRVPARTSMYNEAQADVYVVAYNQGMGAMPHRMVANDPVACTGAAPHAVQNTWPKWAPNPLDPSTQKPVPQRDKAGNTYYWVTFSSTRSPTAPMDPSNKNKRKQQLYVAGVVVDAGGKVNSFAPIYLWNQDYTVNNLIPAWGEFSIPPGAVPPPMPTAM